MALSRRTWTISRNKFPGKSNILKVLEDATIDEAMAVVREKLSLYASGGTVSASDTDFVNVSVQDPTDPHGMPIYEGSILNMGEHLVPGTFFATNLDSDRNWVNEYEIEEDGSVWHRMR